MQNSLSRRDFFQHSYGLQDSSKLHIGGIPISTLRDEYRAELFQRFVKNMDRYIIDHRYGGFMCDFDVKENKLLSTVKKTWWEGRGIYIYSLLHNSFGKEASYLEVARKSVAFITSKEPTGNFWWKASFTREGEPLPADGDIYCHLYLAEGLIEFSKATNKQEYLGNAKRLLLSAWQAYNGAGYSFPVTYGPEQAEMVNAPRVVGHWMVFLRASTIFLDENNDPEISLLAAACVDALMKRHMNPQYSLINETLHHDYSRVTGKWSNFSYLATALQALWMVMAEAIRIKNKLLFEQSGRAFKRHMLVAQDAVYAGHFRSLDDITLNRFKTDKVLSLQQEIMTGCMLLVEHADDEMAKQVFAQTYRYIRQFFYHNEFAFPVESGNRSMQEYTTRGIGNYHHPRHLILTLLAFERLMARKGSVSGVFGPVKI